MSPKPFTEEELDAAWEGVRLPGEPLSVADVPLSVLKARKRDVEARLSVLQRRRAAAVEDMAALKKWMEMGSVVVNVNAADTIILCADLELVGYAEIVPDGPEGVGVNLTEKGRELLAQDGDLPEVFGRVFPDGDMWRGGKAEYLREMTVVAKSIDEGTRA